MLTYAERSNSQFEMYNRMGDKWGVDLRSAMPGIVQSFDPVEQTVTVQPAIQERIIDDSGNVNMVNLPLLLDVPVCFIGGGGYTMTFPIQKGDECLVIFGDQCIDSWWSNGGVQAPIEQRRHDLSDAFAVVGLRSQPRRLSNYSTISTQIRSDDGNQYIDLSPNGIAIKGNVSIEGTLTASGINMTTHTHTAPADGGTTSGPS
ncbi:Gp138 family membrane-puncturing spike protein [Desulfosporosinus sp. PR]|uniref:Gp138 family membrane-puncturing spike protein n=1 Tax=Candidatus Desulfosporosinus nitrosoreducens TaxID=3401928 RepID=UPI0027FD005B|nr:Gp138 family membrane-puncturing spike protein [Desulfosporosinus sp. PR]MDQ7094224.1 Gp138 family membrane-puncturing spike protein [Desulfosporosinus sp. PR]